MDGNKKKENSKKPSITFYGGVGTVTGANFLLEWGGKKILIDCGIFQGGKNSFSLNSKDFSYDPSEIDMLIVTHAHADHIGRIPKLVRDGFNGIIYSTSPTKEISEIMFRDGVRIIEREARKLKLKPYYEEKDAEKSISLWKGIPYHNRIKISEDFSFTLFDAGHILGSAMVKFHINEKNILFTGDLGNSPDPLLKDTEYLDDIDYIIMESVYGDRLHEEREERIIKLERVIENTIHKKGVLLIPVFALERAQNLLFILNNLVEENRIQKLPIFMDSPLSINITKIFRKNTEFFNKEVKKKLLIDDDLFSFPGLKETYSVEESKAILYRKNPKIIIASAGMSHAGRIIHHEKQYLGDPNNTILFIGYQAVGTFGRMIQDGIKKINIFGKDIKIRAKIITIQGYSAHRDRDALVDFVEATHKRVKKVFCVMGEPKTSVFLAQRLQDYLGIDASVPEEGDVFEII